MSNFLRIVNEARQDRTVRSLSIAVSAAAAEVAADPKAGIVDGVFSPKDNISRLRAMLSSDVDRVVAAEIIGVLDGFCRRYYGTIGNYWVQVVPGVWQYGDAPDCLRVIDGRLYRRKGAGRKGGGVRWVLEEEES